MPDPEQSSAFVPLPVRHGEPLRILGPRPAEAATAVEPLVRIDQPLGVVQSFVGGLCDRDGRLLRPVEIALVLDPRTARRSDEIPLAASYERFTKLPELLARLPVRPGTDVLSAVRDQGAACGPLLYCRKRHCVFEARSPNDGQPLRAVPAEQSPLPAGAETLPAGLLSWDGPQQQGGAVAVYGGQAAGGGVQVRSLDQLILDQARVVESAAKLAPSDPLAAERLAAAHLCCKCPERQRCHPGQAGYAFAADRLVVISAARAPLVVLPLGEWRLDEAVAVIGGLPAEELFAAAPDPENEFESWRRQRSRRLAAAGPPRLLAGEADGRELLEVARLKLALIAGVLEQLDAAWRATGQPHLCWNDQTVRVAWRRPVSTPAACWGFQPLLRKVGLQPAAPLEVSDQAGLPYPPVRSQAELLPAEVVQAARYFGQSRAADVFVSSVRSEGAGVGLEVVLEDFGLAWELSRPADVLELAGDGWQARLRPAPRRAADDADGWPCSGHATGKLAGLKPEARLEGCACRWYPRFGQAVDLHVLGMLLFEALLTHDARSGAELRRALPAEREALTAACRAVPRQRRAQAAQAWIAARAAGDAPADIWSRRNLLFRRADRAAVRLEAFPAGLWLAIIAFGWRLSSAIAGFSFCGARDEAAPRLADEVLLPLVEVQGLIGLLDDLIFGRSAPGAALRALFQEAP